MRGVSSEGEPVGEETVFEIGSITKVFTGVALASCADLGLVQLDEPLRRLLPPGARLTPGADAVTLAHLASHSSGLPRMPPGVPPLLLGGRARERARRLDADDLFAALARTRLRDPPGRRYRYSNLGVSLLGHALARRAGCGWADLVQTLVCEPLGLARTRVGVIPAQGSSPPGRSLLGREVRCRGRWSLRSARAGAPAPPWSGTTASPAASRASPGSSPTGAPPPSCSQAASVRSRASVFASSATSPRSPAFSVAGASRAPSRPRAPSDTRPGPDRCRGTRRSRA